jgi:hypothetical protein
VAIVGAIRKLANGDSFEIDERRMPRWTKRFEFQVDDPGEVDPDSWALPYFQGDEWTNDLLVSDPDYVSKPGIICKSIRVEPSSEDGCEFSLTYEFGYDEGLTLLYERTEFQLDSVGYPSADPLDWKPKIEYGWVKEQEACRWGYAYSGGGAESMVPITNSAGDVFVPAPTRSRNLRVISISRLQPSYDPDDEMLTWDSLIGTVCSEDMLVDGVIYPARSLFMDDITWRRFYVGFQSYWIWDVSYRIIVDRDRLHKAILLDQGYYTLDGTDRVPITDITGALVASPVLLDGSGDLLSSGASPVFREFEINPRATWETLELPL